MSRNPDIRYRTLRHARNYGLYGPDLAGEIMEDETGELEGQRRAKKHIDRTAPKGLLELYAKQRRRG